MHCILYKKEKKTTGIGYTSASLNHCHYVHRHFECHLSLTSMKSTVWISFWRIDDLYNTHLFFSMINMSRRIVETRHCVEEGLDGTCLLMNLP